MQPGNAGPVASHPPPSASGRAVRLRHSDHSSASLSAIPALNQWRGTLATHIAKVPTSENKRRPPLRLAVIIAASLLATSASAEADSPTDNDLYAAYCLGAIGRDIQTSGISQAIV